MTARATFTQAQLARAIKAAKAAGMQVTRCELTPDGRIVLSEQGEQPAHDPFAEWKAKRESKSAGR